jgi:glycosyltransferase involved in cell wall biosynthesis
VPYKRVDLVVEAFNRTGLPLVVIGDGPERARLEALAGPNVSLLGRLGSREVSDWLSRCRAYVYAGLEDFGIAPVEAMAAGAPVIGLGQGGLLDTVRCLNGGDANPTGLLFPEQSVDCLQAALEAFEADRLWRRLPAESLRRWAEQFSPDLFRLRMAAVIEQAWGRHRRELQRRSGPLPMTLG